MFCSNCGARASGNFCSGCGARLGKQQAAELPPQDWVEEVQYSVLLHFSEVREHIAHHASQAKKGLSGEQFLKGCDSAFGPVFGVSLSTVASVAVPIYSRLGINTGKKRAEVVRRPPGKVIVAAICSLARYGRTLKQVHQGEDGCIIEAVVPSDVWSFEGELIITVHRCQGGTQVEAATKIPGQIFDWGKSNQCLTQLFQDLESLLK